MPKGLFTDFIKLVVKHEFTKLTVLLVLGAIGASIVVAANLLAKVFNIDPKKVDEVMNAAGSVAWWVFVAVVIAYAVLVLPRRVKAEIKAGAFPTFFPQRTNQQSPPPLPAMSVANPPPALPLPASRQPIAHPMAAQAGIKRRSFFASRGCLFIAGTTVILLFSAIGGGWYVFKQYEKRPKAPGEIEFNQAESFIRQFKDVESEGNSPAARILADQFARDYRQKRELFFTTGKADMVDMTKGRFLTYCYLKKDSAVFIVHVPDLNGFRSDAKLSLEEVAWKLANDALAKSHPEVKTLALGIRGNLDYSSIVTGVVNPQESLKGIEKRHPLISQAPLWPYFVPDHE